MPYVNGPIEPGGAIIDVLVGVPSVRKSLLKKHGFTEPFPVPVRVLIDTGSSHTGFSPRIFSELGISPVSKITILTPSTLPDEPHECDLCHVSLSLVAEGSSRPFGDRYVILADCWLENEGIEGLIGRDILDHCAFWYLGTERTFTLAFA